MRLLIGKETFSDEELNKMLEMLKYRLDELARADELAKVMGVTNEAFDAYSFNHQYWKMSKKKDHLDYFAWRLLINKGKTEKPVEDLFWPKP
jgi:hypothetical protein